MRLVRKLLVAVAAAVGVVALLLVAGGWYFSSVALTVDHATYYELPVLAADDADVTLRYEREVTFPGVYDIPWDGGRAVLGNVLEVAPPDGDDAGSVRRALVRVSEGDLADAAEVAWGYQVYTGDPKTALGLEFTEVTYPSPVGDMPAWLVPAADPDPTTPWVVAVHGINGSRQDFLRMSRPCTKPATRCSSSPTATTGRPRRPRTACTTSATRSGRTSTRPWVGRVTRVRGRSCSWVSPWAGR